MRITRDYWKRSLILDQINTLPKWLSVLVKRIAKRHLYLFLLAIYEDLIWEKRILLFTVVVMIWYIYLIFFIFSFIFSWTYLSLSWSTPIRHVKMTDHMTPDLIPLCDLWIILGSSLISVFPHFSSSLLVDMFFILSQSLFTPYSMIRAVPSSIVMPHVGSIFLITTLCTSLLYTFMHCIL